MVVALSLVVGLAVAGLWLAWRLRLPSILILLATGILVGPVARNATPGLFGKSISLDPSTLMAPEILMGLVGLGIGLILFEGGLTLNWREISGVRHVVVLLVTVGALCTWVMAAGAARLFLGLDWPLAILLGAVLVVTGPTVVGPLLHFIRPTGKSGSVLRWEGIVIDPVGAMLAVIVFELIAAAVSGSAPTNSAGVIRGMIQSALLTIALGAATGAVAGLMLIAIVGRRLVPDQLEIPATLALVLGAYVGGNQLAHEGGLYATTVMGVLLANQQRVAVRHIVEFKEIIATLLIGILFIILAARVDVKSFSGVSWGVIPFIVCLMLIVRPLSVLLSTRGSVLTMKDRLFVAAMAPRGIVAAGVASLFAMRLGELDVAGAEQLANYTFLVVVATVLIYGLGAAPAARLLGLAKTGQRGFLIVGADPFARELARAIAAEHIDVLLVDTNGLNIRQARLMGLPVRYGNALSTDVLETVALSPIGHLLALTSNEEVNSMAAVQFGRIFGRNNVFQLAEKPRASVPASRAESDRALAGRRLFTASADHETLERMLRQGAKVTKTRLTDTFTYEEYVRRNQGRFVPLFLVKSGGIRLIVPDAKTSAGAGHQVVSLIDPAEAPAAAEHAGAVTA